MFCYYCLASDQGGIVAKNAKKAGGIDWGRGSRKLFKRPTWRGGRRRIDAGAGRGGRAGRGDKNEWGNLYTWRYIFFCGIRRRSAATLNMNPTSGRRAVGVDSPLSPISECDCSSVGPRGVQCIIRAAMCARAWRARPWQGLAQPRGFNLLRPGSPRATAGCHIGIPFLSVNNRNYYYGESRHREGLKRKAGRGSFCGDSKSMARETNQCRAWASLAALRC